MPEVTGKLLASQYEFIQSQSKFALMLGGVGSSKTHAGAHFVINMASKYPKVPGIICANTYNQVNTATLARLEQECEKFKIYYKPVLGGSEKHVKIGGTKALIYSLDAYDNIRGPEVGWAWADECLFAKEEAFKVLMGRIRDGRGPCFFRGTSTPNGFNWGYETFEGFEGENRTPLKHLIRAKTKDNVFLPDGYYETLLEMYGGADNPLAQQELEGLFVNLNSGAIYWGFDRKRNIQPCELRPGALFYLGQDFNVNPMCGVVCQYYNGIIYVVAENVLPNSNTFECSGYLREKFPMRQATVIPDSTGSARKTSANKTDIQIMRDHGFHVADTKNPLIRDRQNCLNVLMKRGRVVIDPSCTNLIKEIETLSSRDKEGDKSHCAVALGYVAWYLAPLREIEQPSRTLEI